MSVHAEVLGGPLADNALMVRVDAGRATHRLLFDVGQGVLDDVPRSDVAAIDHLFFSHFHIDHVAGFDAFVRVNAARERPVRVWGPPGTRDVVHHRLRGVTWNLAPPSGGEWFVTDIDGQDVRTARMTLPERFAQRHDLPPQPFSSPVLTHPDFSVDVRLLDHRTPSAAYIVREPARRNVDTARLAELGLTPGPWLARLKSNGAGEHAGRDLDDLRAEVLTVTPGESVAYLTDFLLSDDVLEDLAAWLGNVTLLVCESQYRHDDLRLAALNHHVTSVQAARLANAANAAQLVLFHVSERYGAEDRAALLREARDVFERTSFPASWEP